MDEEAVFSELWIKSKGERTNVHMVVGYTTEAMRFLNQDYDETKIVRFIDKKISIDVDESVEIRPNEKTDFYLKNPEKRMIDFDAIEFPIHKTAKEIYDEMKGKVKPPPNNLFVNSKISIEIPKVNNVQITKEEQQRSEMKKEATEMISFNQTENVPIEKRIVKLEQPNVEHKKEQQLMVVELPKLKEDEKTEHKIIGTSQNLEKNYLRIAEETDPQTIRPLPVLKKSFDFVKRKYEEKKDYAYIVDQLKSIRQDMVVQGIRDDFTREVYKYDLVVELDNDNLTELITCIHCILELDNEIHIADDFHIECVSIKLLDLHRKIHKKSTMEFYEKIAELTKKESDSPIILFVLRLLKYLTIGEMKMIGDLIKSQTIPPLLLKYMQLYFIPTVRSITFEQFYSTFMWDWPIDNIKEMLLFEQEEECINYLKNEEQPKPKYSGFTINEKERTITFKPTKN